jgi:hypothetical protein
MAYVLMSIVPNSGRFVSYEISVSLSAAGNSDWILVPPDIRRLSITLSVAGGGQGKVQATTDVVDTVKNGTPTAIDWDYGTVSANTQEVADPCTAVRLVQDSASGTTQLTLRGST